jgi:hypothetical protein
VVPLTIVTHTHFSWTLKINDKIKNYVKVDIFEFNLMPTNDQAAYTWEFGTYLASRSWKNHSINLYHVDKFFVEVWYDPGMNHVDKIRSFKSRNCLEPYLESIFLEI